MANYAALEHILDDSARLDADVAHLVEVGWNTSTRRQLVCMALCNAALEHAVSQRVLMAGGNSGTALALIRLHFEATIRAAWTQKGATDSWLEEFTMPIRLTQVGWIPRGGRRFFLRWSPPPNRD